MKIFGKGSDRDKDKEKRRRNESLLIRWLASHI